MATLTDRRISSAVQAVIEQVVDAYEIVFYDDPADQQFFDEIDEAIASYHQRTQKRPIKPADVKAAQRILRDKCRALMKEAKNRERSRRDEG